MFYIFENYTLRHSDTHVKARRPSLYHAEYKFDSIDHSEVLNLFPVNNDQYIDVQNMLLSISDLVENRNTIRDFLTSNSDSPSESVDVDYVDSKLRKTMFNVFISIISSITNPVISTIITITLFLSMFWAIVLTILSVKHIFNILKSTVNLKRQSLLSPPNV